MSMSKKRGNKNGQIAPYLPWEFQAVSQPGRWHIKLLISQILQ